MNILKPLAIVLTFSVSTLNVPLWAFALPGDKAPAPKEAKEVKPVASRKLTDQETKTLKGKTATYVNPYVSGTSKLSVTSNGVDLITGNFTTGANDLNFEGGYGIPVNVTRAYSANNGDEGPFGIGWTLSCDMRSTAGGLLKSAGAPNRSVPVLYRDRMPDESDLRLFERGSGGNAGGGGGSSFSPTDPVEAVVSVDASGQPETVQRDADGIWTSPPWEKNRNQPTYETVQVGSALYDVMIANVVTTPDGSVYTYEKMGEFDTETNEVPRNILKITKVEDRHGNQTLYTYSTSEVDFIHAGVDWTETSSECKLEKISMPDGNGGTPGGDRDIDFTWGNGTNAPTNRIRTVTDGTRTVTYGYSSGFLTSVTTPGGKVTQYAYGATLGPEESEDIREGILTEITDHRGLTTKIYYVLHDAQIAPTEASGPKGPFATLIRYPNGRVFYLADRRVETDGAHESYWPFEIGDPLDTSTLSYHPFVEYAGVTWSGDEITNLGTQINHGGLDTEFNDETDIYTLTMRDPWALKSNEGTPASAGNITWKRDFFGITQDVYSEEQYIYPYQNDSLASDLDMEDADSLYHKILNTPTFNYMGNPLSKTVDEYEGTSLVRTSKVQYAYWGSDKYFQQKATRVRVGVSGGNDVWRYSYTDYFDSSASAGSKGQVKAVYDAKYGTVHLNTGATIPSWDSANTANHWRWQVEPTNTGCASATFTYNALGQPITVDKLKTAGTIGTPSTYTYVKTVTDYDGECGNADKVIEDQGTGKLNRTTETLNFDSAGRATEVKDAADHTFETTYYPDGEIQTVTCDSDPVVTYEYYNDSGDANSVKYWQVSAITDELAGVEQTFQYASTGGGMGQVASISEDRGNSVTTMTSYTYDLVGNRDWATYATPNGTTKWQYDNYLRVGSPESAQYVFQRLSKLDAYDDETAEQMYYGFDTAGRLLESVYAQSPAGSPDLSDAYLAATRARTHSDYSPGGQLLLQQTGWEVLSSGEYGTPTAIYESECTYETYTGLRSSGTFTSPTHGPWTENYTYDADLGYLTSVDYNDGADQVQSWTYDAAGNRISDSKYSGGGTWTYDNLNRMEQSPKMSSTGGASPWTYQYDAMGNRLSRNYEAYGTNIIQDDDIALYEWDAVNRLTKTTNEANGASFRYRADGLRVEKVSGLAMVYIQNVEDDSGYYDDNLAVNKPTTRWYYDGQMAMEDDFRTKPVLTNPDQYTVNKYGLGARGIDYMERWYGTPSSFSLQEATFPVYDGHGNMVLTIARDGSSFSVANERRYDVWGSVRAGSSTGAPAGRYCANLGHQQDDESGLIYMRARFYEPGSGRFISQDPAMDGFNWFAYCGNDPVGSVDPDGKMRLVDADVYGNLLIALGFFMLNNGRTFRQLNFEWLQQKATDRIIAGLGARITGTHAAYFKLAIKMIRVYRNAVSDNPAGVSRAVVAYMGYSLMLLGQCFLTDAEFEGGVEWWGWEAISGGFIP